MTILGIRTLGDPVLREAAHDVDAFDALERLYRDMLETMYEAPGVGLAAPQVGLSLRFFCYDAGDGSGPGAVANPTLTLLEGEQVEDEGCLSIPGMYFPTHRHLNVRVEGMDLGGRPIVLDGEGLLARIFQHETDHLNGMLFVDRLTGKERREAMAALRDQELAAHPSPGRPRRG